LIPADHLSRAIDAFVARLDLGKFRFAKASAAATGRPSCDPADLLKFYVYGYLQQVRSSLRIARRSPSSIAGRAMAQGGARELIRKRQCPVTGALSRDSEPGPF